MGTLRRPDRSSPEQSAGTNPGVRELVSANVNACTPDPEPQSRHGGDAMGRGYISILGVPAEPRPWLEYPARFEVCGGACFELLHLEMTIEPRMNQ